MKLEQKKKGLFTDRLRDKQAVNDGTEFRRHMEEARQNREAAIRAQIEHKRTQWFGTFDTELVCNCRAATISDRALDRDPHPVARTPRLGPRPTLQEINDSIRVWHQYVCLCCGCCYDNEVIEQNRTYVPRERDPRFAPPPID